MKYLIGDATAPQAQGQGARIIAHVTNNLGAWGAGFVMALSSRWTAPEVAYKAFPQKLGGVQLVQVGPPFPAEGDLWVANMCAQEGFPSRGRPCALSYAALEECLEELAFEARAQFSPAASIHMPRIGCGIAGGDWGKVSALIEDKLVGLDVTIYDLPQEKVA